MNNERELGWDDEIEKDGGGFTLLPAGDYSFTVSKFERARFTPGPNSKIPACNQAKLELTIHSPQHGDVTVFHNLYLHTMTEGLLSNFFTGIGQKKKGEKLRMNWQTVIGARGTCKLKINKYRTNKGEDRENNQVDTFYDPAEAPQVSGGQPAYQQPAQPTYQAPPVQPQQPTQQPVQQAPFPTGTPQQQQGGFVPGQF